MQRILLCAACLLSLVGCATAPKMTAVESPIPQEPMRTQLARLQPGEQVQVLTKQPDSETRTTGVVLHSSPDGLALMNCVTEGRASSQPPWMLHKVPYVSRLFKNTGVGKERIPVLWLPAGSAWEVSVLAPPAPDFVAPQLPLNTQHGPEFERIGIDFDFNDIYENGKLTMQTATPVTRE